MQNNHKPLQHLGGIVRANRKEKNLTLEKLALLCGISKSMGRWAVLMIHWRHRLGNGWRSKLTYPWYLMLVILRRVRLALGVQMGICR